MILSSEACDGAPEPLGARVVVFCHYDRQGRIRDHTRAYIEALNAEQLDIVFVTNSGRLTPLDHAWIREHAARVIVRRNVGHDFAAWRDAMAACGLPSMSTHLLLLANDSVYGPLYPLSKILSRIDFNHADVWGATDSWQHRFHLQSFFMAFGPKALAHRAFAQFWSSVNNVRSKSWVIKRYELGLSHALMAEGLRCRALWPYAHMIEVLRGCIALSRSCSETELADKALKPPLDEGMAEFRRRRDPITEVNFRNADRVMRAALNRTPLNPTADLWQVLIRQGCPFLKRELLRHNPSKVPDVAAWLSTIGEIGGYDTDLIMRDLERTLRNRAP